MSLLHILGNITTEKEAIAEIDPGNTSESMPAKSKTTIDDKIDDGQCLLSNRLGAY